MKKKEEKNLKDIRNCSKMNQNSVAIIQLRETSVLKERPIYEQKSPRALTNSRYKSVRNLRISD